MSNRRAIVASALEFREMPKDGQTEFAFMGRSNAGKSSLLNRLMGAKVANISATPGKTQRINFFAMPGWYMVDLPGYGYAQVSRSAREKFGRATERYLTERQTLVGGVLVQDLRRDPEEEEDMVVRWAADRNLYVVVVGTKMDKLNRAQQAARRERLNLLYKRKVILVSNRTGEGIDEVRQAIRAVGLKI
ncbi:MAG: ribosome biogenesis GTP-binding protein YihA/YsxC [Thermaerobacter sp.]|nr:ribosome biogenesis GTP-binding protein YihA/YsxC [Thermaerobacter sp.]